MVCPSLAPARASMPSSRGSESSRLYISVKSVSAALIVRTLRSSRTLRSIEDFRSTGTKPAPPPDDAFPHMFQDIESLTYKHISNDNASGSSFELGSRGNLLKLVQHSMCVGLQHLLVPLPFRMLYRLSCAALSKQKGDNATEFAKCHIPSVVVEGSLLSGLNLLLRVLGGLSQRVLDLPQSAM